MNTLADLILSGSMSGVKWLVEQGEDIDAIDHYGFTPLIETIIADRLDMTEYLIAKKADVDAKDLTGRSALHWAADLTRLDHCALLLKHGADPNAYTAASEPVLVNPFLRDQKELRQLLVSAGGSLQFTKDFINAKLIGHRFELLGDADIVNAKGEFVPLDFEGFFLEFTLAVVARSVREFMRNFAARYLSPYTEAIDEIVTALEIALKLAQLRHHTVRLEDYQNALNRLLQHPRLLLPVVYEGHAISLIKWDTTWVKCDRGYNSKREPTVVVYKAHHPERATSELIQALLYEPQNAESIHSQLNEWLGLEPIDQLDVPAQKSGNCSWANVEATVPAMLYLILRDKKKALDFYSAWHRWDQDRELHYCLSEFETASPARKASIASILGAVLFQRCRSDILDDRQRAAKILKVLKTPEYRYVLDAYMDAYRNANDNPAAYHFKRLMDYFDVGYP